MKKVWCAFLFILCAAIICSSSQSFAVYPTPLKQPDSKQSKKPSSKTPSRAAGRYLIQIAGCNDCHTRGWIMSEGNIPEPDWLTGDNVGWWGPWGTTYALNLRLFFQDFTEDAWIRMARSLKARPPMPWYAIRKLKDSDLRAIYRFIRGLGPKGEEAPSYLPPDQEPKAPYFRFMPPSES